MNRAGWLALASALACAGCANETEDGGDSSEREQTASEPKRPAGWHEATHGRGVDADYGRVFDGESVHRIDITLSAESHQQMLDDMENLIGKLGEARSGFGAPRAMMSDACKDRVAGDSCMLEVSDGEGTCRAFGSGQMVCLPKDFAPGRRPGNGAIDLIGGDPIYVPATIAYDGERWEKVAMRYKGNSSLRGSWGAGQLKLGFRLNFDHFETESPEIRDQRFFGFSELTFSSAYRDASFIRDHLAAELATDFGLTTARTAFYRVYVDVGEGPEYWGLYTLIEDPSDELIEAQFEDDGGNMYKPDGPGANWSRFDEAGFVKKTNQEQADYGDVMAAVAALHASRDDAEAWRAELEATFDVDEFLRVLAFSRAIGHWDGYGMMAHNYYLYGDPSQNGRLVWISWDHNLTWQAPSMGMRGFGDLSVMMDEVSGEDWPLIRFLLDDPTYRERYVAALGEMLEGAYAKERFDARAAELHALVEPYVIGDEGEREPYRTLESPEAFSTALDDPTRGLAATAEERRRAVEAAIH